MLLSLLWNIIYLAFLHASHSNDWMWNEISWMNWTKTSHERISFQMVFENKIIIHLQLVGKSLKDTEAFDYQIDAETFSRVKF